MRVLAFMFAAFGLVVPSGAQTEAYISGRVTDVTGASIPNVDILVTGGASDLTIRAQTAPDGGFAIEVPAGSYKLKFESRGFRLIYKTALVNPGKPVELGTIALAIAEIGHTVTIAPDFFVIDPASSRGQKSAADLKLEQEVLSLPSGRPQRDPAFLLPPANLKPTERN